MTSDGEIIIRIIEENGGGGKEAKPVDVTGEETLEEAGTGEDALRNAVLTTLLQKAGSELKGLVLNEAKYEIKKYFMLKDDYAGAQQMQVAEQMITSIIGFTAGIAGAIIAGGPVGAAAAAVAIIGAGIKVGIDIYQNMDQQRIKLNQINAQLQYNRQRAGYSLTAGSIGENK